MVINGFTGCWRFLSNFYTTPVHYEGIDYISSEHAYQAAKTLDVTKRQAIAKLRTAGAAKRAGVVERDNWDEIKYTIMHEIVSIKFANPAMKNLLLSTEDDELIEENDHGDTYWGTCRAVGHNNLGKILMAVRSRLKGNVNGQT